MNGSDDTILSTTHDMCVVAAGAADLIETADVETGQSRLGRVTLDARGMLAGAGARDADPEARWDGSEVPAAVARLTLRFPEIPVDDIAAALATVAPEGLRDVASDGTVLFALKEDPALYDGATQALVRLKVKTGRRSLANLDLGPLGLSGGRMITSLVLVEGWLYVMVADATAGFDVFRAKSTATKPVFKAVLDRGARRFALNATVSAAAPCPDAPPGTLLLGTAALAGDDAPAGNWGPELLRLDPDGTWEIVIGQLRVSPDGLKRPLGEGLPGFGDPGNAAIKAIASTEVGGRATTYVVVQDFLGETCEDRYTAIPTLMDYMGSARLFRSPDLVHWEEFPIDVPEDSGSVTSLVVTETGILFGHEGIGDSKLPVTYMPHPV